MAVTGRFAPSPSGRIHLGNILCCLLAWLSARQKGGRVILRIEDLDIARCPRRYGEQMCRDIQWLGLDWDEGPVIGGPSGPYEQSRRTALYQAALRRLEAQGLVYPCFCTRAELHAASAPHREDGQVVYPGTCRGLTAEQAAERARRTGRAPALRLQVPEEEITFTDGHMGEYREWLPADCGDFLLRRSDGIFAYQLAVVVDDAAMGVTEVVRGADLLASTPRQLLLYRLLGLEAPAFCHFPLLLGSDDSGSASGTRMQGWTRWESGIRHRKSWESWHISQASTPRQNPEAGRACWRTLPGRGSPERISAFRRDCFEKEAAQADSLCRFFSCFVPKGRLESPLLPSAPG